MNARFSGKSNPPSPPSLAPSPEICACNLKRQGRRQDLDIRAKSILRPPPDLGLRLHITPTSIPFSSLLLFGRRFRVVAASFFSFARRACCTIRAAACLLPERPNLPAHGLTPSSRLRTTLIPNTTFLQRTAFWTTRVIGLFAAFAIVSRKHAASHTESRSGRVRQGERVGSTAGLTSAANGQKRRLAGSRAAFTA